MSIEKSIYELERDMRKTNNIIKKTILKNLIQLKLHEMKNKKYYVEQDKKIKKNKKLKSILKKKENSLRELENISKIQAYQELLEENKIENEKKVIDDARGKNEKYWNNKNNYDPKYSKYIKQDTMNNRLMERLNTEIDFRFEDNKNEIVKPFDNCDNDNIEGINDINDINTL
jgi:hypothetical protein